MISYLGSPPVCVIDDEERDYMPIIEALIGLGVGCAHFRGGNGDPLPPTPLESVRLVFLDLHLTAQVGRSAAAHTANVFRRIVPADKGPILVVIWSKYASDRLDGGGAPDDDQPTEADMLKEMLLGADPGYKSRVLFTEMAKPKAGADRPAQEEWVEELKRQISETLLRAQAFQAFWVWEFLLRRAGTNVEESLIALAQDRAGAGVDIKDTLELVLRHVAQLQAGPDVSDATICKHLMSVFAQLGADDIERGAAMLPQPINTEWLRERVKPADSKRLDLSKKLNGLLQTASSTPAEAKFAPGTLFTVNDVHLMEAATGFSLATLVADCYDGEVVTPEFQAAVTPVFLELTPACDFHQGHRRSALLLAGLLFPAVQKKAKNKDACKTVPPFEDRYHEPPIDVGVVFCARYRITLPLSEVPAWLTPRLRFRDGLLTDLRNWHSAQASRAGYLIVS